MPPPLGNMGRRSSAMAQAPARSPAPGSTTATATPAAPRSSRSTMASAPTASPRSPAGDTAAPAPARAPSGIDGQAASGDQSVRQSALGNGALTAVNDDGAGASSRLAGGASERGRVQSEGAGEGAGEGGSGAASEGALGEGAGTGAGGAPAEAAAETVTRDNGAAASSESPAVRVLGQSLPSQASQALTNARTAASDEITSERQALSDNPPSMDAPSGLMPGDGRTGQDGDGSQRQADASGIDDQDGEGQEQEEVETEHQEATAPVDTGPTAEALVRDVPTGFTERIRAYRERLNSLPTSDRSIVTNGGPRPDVELTADADPGRYDTQVSENQVAIDAETARAREGMQEDEGVDDIYPTLPDEILAARMSVGETRIPQEPADPMAELSPDLRRGMDQGAAPNWDREMARAAADHSAAATRRRDGEARERAATDREIAEAEGEAARQQIESRNVAHGEVSAARDVWGTEIDNARTVYTNENTRVRGQLRTDVDNRVNETRTEVDGHFNEAERSSEAERVRVEGEADTRRAEAERQRQESDGWFDRAISWVKDRFADLKRGLKRLFDGLRKFVKKAIEGAKKLAARAIEFGRRAVVGLIRKAGAALEFACDVFLAAYPEARDRAKARIRRGVAAAEDAVNRAAEWLRERVNALLDLLGKALIAILDIYEAFYNALLSVAEFLVVGLIEIGRGLYRIGLATTYSPGEFPGQVQEELLGADLSQPLPFELTESEAAPIRAQAEAARAAASGLDMSMTSDDAAAEADLGPMPTNLGPESENIQPVDPNQIEVDPVAGIDLSDELLASIDWGGRDEVEFGENNAPENTLAGWDEESAGPALEAGPAEMGAGGGGADMASAPAGEEGAEPGPREWPTDPDVIERRLQEAIDRDDSADEADNTQKPSGPAPEVPIAAKFGPLTAAQRGRFMLGKMWSGIRRWFADNWGYVLAGIVALLAIIAGVIAASVATGGAVLAGLGTIVGYITPVLMVVMAGVALYAIAEHVGNWLSKSWGGDIIGGAKGFARFVAVGLVELIMAILTYITAGAFRAVAGAMKASKGAVATAVRASSRAVRRATASSRRAFARGVRRGSRAFQATSRAVVRRTPRFIRRGATTVVRGSRRAIGRGSRNLRQLGTNLGRRFRFRRFKLRRRGRWFRIYGLVNPWILLANGEVEWHGGSDVTDIGHGKGLGSTVRVGSGNSARSGVVVGRYQSKPSALVQRLQGPRTGRGNSRLQRSLRGHNADTNKWVLQSQNRVGRVRAPDRTHRSLQNPDGTPYSATVVSPTGSSTTYTGALGDAPVVSFPAGSVPQTSSLTGRTVNITQPSLSNPNQMLRSGAQPIGGPSGSTYINRTGTVSEFSPEGFLRPRSHADVNLPPNQVLNGSRDDHFQAANEILAGDIAANPLLAYEMRLTPEALADIQHIRPIAGGHLRRSPRHFTWHHNELTGRMNLVKRNGDHVIYHVGGFTIWGRP